MYQYPKVICAHFKSLRCAKEMMMIDGYCDEEEKHGV